MLDPYFFLQHSLSSFHLFHSPLANSSGARAGFLCGMFFVDSGAFNWNQNDCEAVTYPSISPANAGDWFSFYRSQPKSEAGEGKASYYGGNSVGYGDEMLVCANQLQGFKSVTGERGEPSE